MTVTDVSADFSDLKTCSVSLFMHLVEGFLLREEGLQRLQIVAVKMICMFYTNELSKVSCV